MVYDKDYMQGLLTPLNPESYHFPVPWMLTVEKQEMTAMHESTMIDTYIMYVSQIELGCQERSVSIMNKAVAGTILTQIIVHAFILHNRIAELELMLPKEYYEFPYMELLRMVTNEKEFPDIYESQLKLAKFSMSMIEGVMQ